MQSYPLEARQIDHFDRPAKARTVGAFAADAERWLTASIRAAARPFMLFEPTTT
jgi:hypothetical protein